MTLDKEALEKAAREILLFVAEQEGAPPWEDLGDQGRTAYIEAAQAAITAYLAACAEKGFRMMPREVDDRMWEAGRARYPTLDELEDGLEEQGEDVYFEVIPGPINIWEAMFDAALPAKTEDEE